MSGGANVSNGSRGNVVTGNVSLGGPSLPADARAIVDAAGLEPAYADLRATP